MSTHEPGPHEPTQQQPTQPASPPPPSPYADRSWGAPAGQAAEQAPPAQGPGMGHQRPEHPAFSSPEPGRDPWQPRPVPPWVATPRAWSPPSAPERPQRPNRWLWPVVAVLALVVGLVGGLLGGALSDDLTGGPATTISVERRTAQPLPADNDSIAAVAQELLPSTVQVIAGGGAGGGGGTGSGFVYDTEGHVVTNNHVIAEAAESGGDIAIVDQEGNRFPAEVVGRSTVYDLAVLRSDAAEEMPPAAVGSAQQMRVGETVVAIGSPLGLSSTVTSGIVSAKERPVTTGASAEDSSYINAVQTDAAINPGNSGGPLVNLQGEVVGVNSAIAALGGGGLGGDQGGNIGVGFAIPVEQVEVTAQQILATGKSSYPVIGADVRPVATGDGARVAGINPGSPASRSDLEVGDVIRRVDGKPVTSSIDVVVAVRSRAPGERVTLEVERDGDPVEVEVGLQAVTE
ncbi:S1C family serine protease [Nocardioides marmoraquaticus]